MGYLQIKKIDIQNVKFLTNKYGYKLIYDTPYVKSSLLFELHGITIKENTYEYIITISDKHSIKALQQIDTLCSNKLRNYKPILHFNDNIYYMVFRKNNILHKLLDKYKKSSTISINIIKLKNRASHYHPIVYIQ